MVKLNEAGELSVQINEPGGGEHLLMIQKALMLGIEVIGSHVEHSGYEDYQEAVWVLSKLLREFMLDESQTNVGLGGKAYAGGRSGRTKVKSED